MATGCSFLCPNNDVRSIAPTYVQTMSQDQLEHIHSFLVHPGKNEGRQPFIRGTSVPQSGRLYDVLSDLYRRASVECNIEIVFVPEQGDSRKNKLVNLLVKYAKSPSLASGRSIAESLQTVTTNRSGLGLLFLMKGTYSDGRHTLVISRFPASQGITATEGSRDLTVQFLEQVFMKNANTYKSAFFQTTHLDAGFLEGRAIDRQSMGIDELSEYWIKDFLMSQIRTTGPAGTRRLAEAVRGALRDSVSPELRQELIATTTLLRGQAGKTQTTTSILDSLGVSEDATQAIGEHFTRPELMGDTFTFDSDEFDKHVHYRTVELDNGAILTAEDKEFSNVFREEHFVDGKGSRYTTEGIILTQKLRKTK